MQSQKTLVNRKFNLTPKKKGAKMNYSKKLFDWIFLLTVRNPKVIFDCQSDER